MWRLLKIMKEIRKKIDNIDTQLADLLDKRADLVREIGKMKKDSGEPVFAPGREKKIIEKILTASETERGLPAHAKINIFSEIMAACRALQKELRISFLGPEATFTHQAAVQQFSDYCIYLPASTIRGVFREVENKRADYGVVPVENSSEGIVSHTLDMFFDSECKICAEMLMKISHNLLSKEKDLSDIKTVYSKDQALAQCSIWLEEHLPGASYVEVSSTAEAAKKAASEKNAAAIASIAAKDVYGLQLLEENIEDASENITRFFVIGRDYTPPSGDDKTSIMFSIKDRVGALHDMLAPFRKNSINLTKIESRPSKIKAWEYLFFIDMQGHIEEEKVKKAVNSLEKDSVFLKVLGSYPLAKSLSGENPQKNQ